MMNAADRKAVSELLGKLEDLNSQFETIQADLATLAEEEREKFDNMTEGLQQAENGQRIEAAADALDEAASAESIQEAIDALGKMDMGYHLVRNLSYVLFPDSFECIGEKCPANDHFNGDRNYAPHMHSKGAAGYALRHRWM